VAGSPAAYVLDTFALLAYLEGEPGMARVRSVLEGAAAQRHAVYLSLINLGEALYITERESVGGTKGGSPGTRRRPSGARGRRPRAARNFT
jgi:predicted nucleic acid-binding protein